MAETRVMVSVGWRPCRSCLFLPAPAVLLLRRVLHPRGLAFQVAQVVQLRAPHAGGLGDFDLLNRGRVEREDALDALAERHLAHGKRRARAAAVDADHDPLEYLNALLVPLAHLDVDLHRVARPHDWPHAKL